jgi:hypothetical protein
MRSVKKQNISRFKLIKQRKVTLLRALTDTFITERIGLCPWFRIHKNDPGLQVRALLKQLACKSIS